MGIIKIFLIAILVSSILSCKIFEIGYNNENGQYVPRKPNFKLKDKENNNIPNRLDTINIYRRTQSYYQGKIEPLLDDKYSQLNKIIIYMKFYSNGRCLSFSISSVDDFGNVNKLKETDLNPNNSNCNKKYYFSKDGKMINVESFGWGDGCGIYLTMNYFLDNSGDTLTMIYNDSKDIYVKEKLPSDWEKYKVDW
jgi:hypothetical protein